jgi:hypothetical protein
MRKNVTQITYDRRAPFIYPGSRDTPLGRRRQAMTWTSDGVGVLFYTILGTLLVMSWIYVPA